MAIDTDSLNELRDLLNEKSVVFGEFTLASGAKSDFYVDCRVTTLDPRGARLIGKVGWELVQLHLADNSSTVDAIGGMTMGADPISLAVAMASEQDSTSANKTLRCFIVRKEPKDHGRGKQIEGNFQEGDTIVVVDDVITTGGSTLKAIDAIEAAGATVAFALVLVDRQEGGRDKIEARGIPVVSFFTKEELRV